MTFEIIPGTIYSAYFPFSDLSNQKKRPVLALSAKDENDDVRIVFITKTFVNEAQGSTFAEGWNFGPNDEDARSVKWIVERLAELRKDVAWECDSSPQPHEANYLKLDSSKAKARLGWQARWRLQTALQKTLEWHQAWRHQDDMQAITLYKLSNIKQACRPISYGTIRF